MTEAELIEAVQEALATQDDPEGYYTTAEWAEMFGLALEATRKRLKKLTVTGNLEHAKVPRVSPLSGVETRTHGYRFKP